jgi:indolepyruvate ferredoxin oxidoreductase beta subunit
MVGALNRIYNVGVIGVGGQGLLTLGRIIGLAAIHAGLDVAVAEVHGMSQRGGSVIVNVRIGEEPSPLIPIGGADLLISLELLEAARYIQYLRRGGVLVSNDFIWPPPLARYPSRDEIVKSLKSKEINLYIYDANKASVEFTGSTVSANIAILGFTMGVDEELGGILGLEKVTKALEEVFKGRVLEVNKELLRKSYIEGVKIAGERRGSR